MGKRIGFSIIIVNFNGKKYLQACIDSILESNNRNYETAYEIIVVDNGSSDGSVDSVKKKYLRQKNKVRTISLEKNYGPARARNEGAKIARGNYLAFLDNDTIVDKRWLTSPINIFKRNSKIAIIQCKILVYGEENKIDSVGEYLGNYGFLVPRAVYGERDKKEFNSNSEILAAKSAGMFIRKSVFLEIGGFDEDFFIYLEETDLAWRCWLRGYTAICCSDSIIYHRFSSTKHVVDRSFNNYLVRFHGSKNYILTLCKNMAGNYLLRILPIHIFLWIGVSIFLLLRGQYLSSKNILKGLSWNMMNVKTIWRKREEIQKKRIISDEEIFMRHHLLKTKPLFYFFKKFKGSQKGDLSPETASPRS